MAALLAGATGLEKPHTRPAALAPSAHRAMEGAARTTSATKVCAGGLGAPSWVGEKAGASLCLETFNEKQPQLYAPFN